MAEFDIRRAGRWNSDTMSNAYLSSFPRAAIKALAGFNVNFQANYYLPRAKEEPSEELARQVWPQIDGWLRRLKRVPTSQILPGRGFSSFLNVLEVSFYKTRSYSGVDFPATQSGATQYLRRRNTPSSRNGS